MNIPDLINLPEKSEGPSRELDAHVRHTLLCPPDSYVKQSEFNGTWCIYQGERNGRPKLFERPYAVPHELWQGEYTRSVDAAISLCERVLPGRGRSMSKGRTRPDEPLYGCQIYASDYAPMEVDMIVVSESEHDVEAICLCMAILKAIPEQQP